MRNKHDFDSIVSLVKNKIGFPGDLYKFNPLKRRIEYCMSRAGISSPGEYLVLLEKSEAELNNLVVELTINLSYFFRNPETYELFEKICIPEITKYPKPAVWSAGCAAGEEPYTIAIIMEKFGIESEILGTDIDGTAIERAKNAVYNQFAVQFIPDTILNNYFEENNRRYRLDEKITTKVKFEVEDLFRTKHKDRFNVVFLRNVLIYLSKSAQIELLAIVKRSLKKKGFLILGKVETMIGIDPDGDYLPVNLKERIFKLK
ncbi:MAG TPA: protein-glutamate O-methyltransferase CheR [bacterium (Candidatus Stahlbacteria)]|nr:protein-glutamate O-methyltransferase CheR [Candidatus Stahlbacteria bacterium]